MGYTAAILANRTKWHSISSSYSNDTRIRHARSQLPAHLVTSRLRCRTGVSQKARVARRGRWEASFLFEFLGLDVLASLSQVVLINLVLASDNVIVIGLAAAAQPHARRRRVGYTNPADRRPTARGRDLLLWVC